MPWKSLRDGAEDGPVVDQCVLDTEGGSRREPRQCHARRSMKDGAIDESEGMFIAGEELAGQNTAHEFIGQEAVPFRRAAT